MRSVIPSSTLNRFMIGLVSVLLLLSLAIYNNLASFIHIGSDLTHITGELVGKVQDAQQMRSVIRDRLVVMVNHMIEGDPFVRDELRLRFYELASRFIVIRTRLESNAATPRELELLKQLRDLTVWATPFQEQVIDLALVEKREVVERFLIESALPAQNRVLQQCDRLLEYYQQQTTLFADESLSELSATHKKTLWISIFTLVLALLLGIVGIHHLRRDGILLALELERRQRTERELRDTRATLAEQVGERTTGLDELIAQLNDAQRIANIGHWHHDLESDLVYWSDQLYRIYALEPYRYPPTIDLLLSLVHKDDRAALSELLERARRQGGCFHCNYRIIDGRGETRHLGLSGEATCDSSGHTERIVGIVHDQSERFATDVRLLQAQTIFRHCEAAIMISNIDGEISEVNPAFCSLTGYTRQQLVGENARLLSSGRHDHAFFQSMRQQLSEAKRWSGEIWNRRSNGELILNRAEIEPVVEAGEVVTIVTTLLPPGSSASSGYTFDPLTTLPRAELIEIELERMVELHRERGRILALTLIDLQGCGKLNHRYGHAAIDQLLRHIGLTLNSERNSEDLAGRIDGDCFILLISNVDSRADAAERLTTMINHCSQPVTVGDETIQPSFNTALVLYPVDGEQPEALLRYATTQIDHAGE